ncbi:hypothetical protein [Novosphingobium sp. BW1]|uniref:hypothetical protein n=1 Tax=Novosphingobium sp. BW1 TaxID=2592621 RepID=UPI0011DED3EF|nr:hypothetical protein [Novosphingobium sp. BW1]TYC90807.1 hypothetical protein FMM79_05975 [Novosphingobium sp. BW1]
MDPARLPICDVQRPAPVGSEVFIAFARHDLDLALAIAMSFCYETVMDGVTTSPMARGVTEEALMTPADPNEPAFCDVAGRRLTMQDCADLTSVMEQARHYRLQRARTPDG